MDENDAIAMPPTIYDDNVFFKQMLDYIPVKFYFNKNPNDLLTNNEDDESITEDQLVDETPKGKPMKKRKKALDPVEQKEKKKARFDPSIPQTVTEVHQKLLQSELKGPEQVNEKKKKKKRPKNDDLDDVSSIRSSTDSLEDLREKIQTRINELRDKRKALGSLDAVEKKRMKRRVSKMEHKLRKKMDRQNKSKGQAANGGVMNGTLKTNPKSPAKPIFNKEGKMVFSKFDFSESGDSKKKTDLPTGKDYKRLLEKVKTKKEKLNQIQKTDKEKAKEMVHQDAWKSAIAKAEGIKVKDNPDLLKKSLKRKEIKKKKSEKVWVERKETLDSKLKDQQDKRKKNLQKRRKGKVEKKMKRLKKKGHIIPGF